MKRITIYLITLLTALIMVACSGGTASTDSVESPNAGETDNLGGTTPPDDPTSVVGEITTENTIGLSWEGDAGDSYYKVVITETADFSSSQALHTITPASSPQEFTLTQSANLYCWVIPVLLNGEDGEPVCANNDSPLVFTFVTEPDMPSNSAVTSNSANDGTIIVTWSGSSNGGSYSVVIDDDANYAEDPISTLDGATSNYELNGLASGTYYTWIITKNSLGEVVEVTAIDPITITNALTDPADTPENVAASFSVTNLGKIDVTWSGETYGGSYTVIVDDDYLFDNDTPVQTVTYASSPLVIDSLSTGSYYIWIIPNDADGTPGDEVQANNTVNPPSVMVYNGSLTAVNDSSSVYAGKTETISTALLLANDTNSFNDTSLSIVSVKNAVGGTAVLNTNNTITFTSTGEADEAASFTYVTQMNNCNLFSAEATVAMTVIAVPPVIATTDTKSVQQGGELYFSITEMLSNDIGSNLQFVSAFSPIGGTISTSGDTITFNSTDVAYENAQFSYKIKDSVMGTEATGTVIVTVDPLPTQSAYIYEDADVFETKKVEFTPATMEDVFTKWARFDGNQYFEDKDATGISSNASAWTLSTAPYTVTMPLNVTPYNGFISPVPLENYTFEATLASNNTDDDSNGLIIAFTRINGVNHSLVAVRNHSGMTPTNGWGVLYCVGDGMTHGNMGDVSLNSGRVVSSKAVTGETLSNWQNNKTRVKIVRTENIIKCYTTAWNDLDNYSGASEIIIDLSAVENSDLAIFQGEQSYGYFSFSQPSSSYEDIILQGGNDQSTISYVDWDSGEVQIWKFSHANAQWEQQTSQTLQDIYGYVRIIKNEETGKRYLIKEHSVELLPPE